MRTRQRVLFGLLAGLSLTCATSGAHAQDYVPGADFAIACENGASYRLSSGSVTFPGDIMTAHLYLSPRHSLPVRLMPVGEGYRYAGRGVWLDGIREHALLYLHKYRPLACVVSRV